ncbi:EKC/KEOPS complex subunit Tprkb-like [Belonocnema kinseyi]|uniref:EKC/KEOPS complex subunit Tprkb-like n=1 Tax=Belonocnema kinseyi TaxID=2817044 RepID=UPI00143DC1F8|nr:EKC/KEOPS complex subunit Tprkb-like [Belonocnema kinseyi]
MEDTKTLTFPLDPQSEKFITLALFTNVKNTAEIRDKLLSGELRCCLLKPALIIDPFQVAVAANKAVCAEMFGDLVTKSVFTETLYNLSITKSISKALNLFGSVDNDTDIMVGLIHKDGAQEAGMKSILELIQGEQVPVSRLGDFSDLEKIQKIYKINETELQVSTLVDSIATRISVKDFVSF